MPDRPRVAVEAEPAFRRLLAERLGSLASIVARAGADVVIVDTVSGTPPLPSATSDRAVPTLLLVRDPHAQDARAALRDGVSGILARNASPDDILAAVVALRAGLIVLDPAARDVFPAEIERRAPARTSALTQRERDVLAMLAGGYANRGIGERLAISENTVKAHVAAILSKLGATTRTEAVTIALRRGLVML